MERVFKIVCTVLLFSLIGTVAGAQEEKDLLYYNQHQNEILPDAQAAFRDGNYRRTAELCRWHYVIVGDSRADALREKATNCARFSEEMKAFVLAGIWPSAYESAAAILAINPDDPEAQKLSVQSRANGRENGHEWVNLGLSVKWATCNVGASTPSDSGFYFAWGETAPKKYYCWEELKYCLSSKGNRFSKYNTDPAYGEVDNNTCLDDADDAARVNWGGRWRMPTSEEQDELREKCTWTWTEEDGFLGFKIVSKVNGNTLFLPAAGYVSESEFSPGNVGKTGKYWSSSLSTKYPRYAIYLDFDTVYVKALLYGRSSGLPVRAVID